MPILSETKRRSEHLCKKMFVLREALLEWSPWIFCQMNEQRASKIVLQRLFFWWVSRTSREDVWWPILSCRGAYRTSTNFKWMEATFLAYIIESVFSEQTTVYLFRVPGKQTLRNREEVWTEVLALHWNYILDVHWSVHWILIEFEVQAHLKLKRSVNKWFRICFQI